MLLYIGIFSFALFFLGDYNDWKWGKRALKVCFPTGFLLLAAVTVLQAGGDSGFRPVVRVVCAAAAAVFLCLLLYTLFFALPAAASYGAPGECRPAVTRGMYALCRHPGVLWFISLYFCLWPAAGLPVSAAAVYSALNLLLVVFEDGWVFPARLKGYDGYKEETPFLLPTAHSIRACCRAR